MDRLAIWAGRGCMAVSPISGLRLISPPCTYLPPPNTWPTWNTEVWGQRGNEQFPNMPQSLFALLIGALTSQVQTTGSNRGFVYRLRQKQAAKLAFHPKKNLLCMPPFAHKCFENYHLEKGGWWMTSSLMTYVDIMLHILPCICSDFAAEISSFGMEYFGCHL